MKVLILAGGFGTRLSEETIRKPKPMVEIGEKPILWHIMKTYSSYGFNEFVILLGYKGSVIKDFFANYFLHQCDVTIDLKENNIKVNHQCSEPWKVHLVDTGLNTMTGGRVKRVQDYIGNDPFMLTYGDGVADINIQNLVDFHNAHDGSITMSVVQPEPKFGKVTFDADGKVEKFQEKPEEDDNNWINAGYFVCNPEILDYIEGDKTSFEKDPLEKLTREGKLRAFVHRGFWRCMDTVRDKGVLVDAWNSGKAPWKVW